MEQAGHACLGHVEIDKFANESYSAMHNIKESEFFANDIRGIKPEDLPEADCWCGGFPCQAFSVAGKRQGFEDTRGTLVYEIFRLASEKNPEILLFENVKGLLNHDKGRTFGTILYSLGQLGYDVEWQLLNTVDFKIPQNRERVFIIANNRRTSRRKVFPITGTNGKAFKQVIGGMQGDRVYDAEGISCTLARDSGGKGAKTDLYLINKNKDEIQFRDNFNCLDANYYKGLDARQQRTGVMICDKGQRNKEHNAILRKVRTEYGKSIRKKYESGEIEESRSSMTKLEPRKDDITNTISTVQKDNLLLQQTRIRRLTPKVVEKDNPGVNLGKEVKNGYAEERNTFKILRVLRKAIGEEAYEKWGINVLTSLQQDDLLQPAMHEKSVSENREKQPNKQCSTFNCEKNKQIDTKKGTVRKLPEIREDRYAPHRLGLSKQYTGELESLMQKLSYEGAHKKRFLFCLWETSERLWVLRKALSKIQKIWEPTIGKEKWNIENSEVKRGDAKEELSNAKYRIRRLTPL